MLRKELDAARARGSWLPGVAAFEALERKIAQLEATSAARPANKSVVTVEGSGLSEQHVLQLLSQQQQQFEALLTAKNVELEGFKQQVDALLDAASRLQLHDNK